jgi:GAF domain-containing protein
MPDRRRGALAMQDDRLNDEEGRLAALRRYEVLDTPADGAFDRVTRLASAILDVPIAIVSLVDNDRIWFKSAAGLDGVSQIDRVPGLCASAILSDELYVVDDAKLDARTLANPLVASEFGLRFYAAAPLHTHDGYNLGTLCVIDREPRHLDEDQLALLEDLAAIVVHELELRLAARLQARRAAELNDDVVQALTIAKLRFEMGDDDEGKESLAQALDASKRILAELVEDIPNLRRSEPA